jgi:Putative auto-transporter adhesin, head GIN domain
MNRIILAVLFALLLAGCNAGGLRGDGNVVTRPLKVEPFTNVQVSGGFIVEWDNGAPSASVTTDENLMEFVEVLFSNGTLHARTTRTVRPTHSITLHLTSASLGAASFSGASRFTAHRLSGPRFSLETAGASKVNLQGSVSELVASMTGASELRAESLQTKSAEVSLTGAGDARLNVSDTLKAAITGAGKVEYSGNPARVERHVSGAGTIRKRD